MPPPSTPRPGPFQRRGMEAAGGVGVPAPGRPAAGAVPLPPAGVHEAHERRWAILGVLIVSLLIVVLDNTVLNVALKTIQLDLGATQSELVWAVDAYILVFASLLFTWGVLADRFGRRRILVTGLVLFMLASALCAFATSPAQLIAFRAIMGIGGAAVLPVTLAIITVVFPPDERGKAIGTWAGAVGAAVALGPVVGGLLLANPQWFQWLLGNDWGAVFLINVPIVLVGLVGIAKVVPETRNPARSGRLDVLGVLMSIVGLTVLVYGIIHAGDTKDWLRPDVLAWIGGGLAILVFFLWYERRRDHPTLDVALFSNRHFSVALTAVTLAFFALSGITFFLAFYLQFVRGFSPLEAGLSFLPFAIGQILAAPRSALRVRRFGERAVIGTGLLVVTSTLLALTAFQATTPLPVALLVFFFIGFGMGNVIAPAATVIQNVLPVGRAGAGSAVQNTVRQVGGALGVAIMGTVLATGYSSRVVPALSGLPAGSARAASDSIGATHGVVERLTGAQTLSAEAGRSLLAEADRAFMGAVHLTSALGAVATAIAAVVVWSLMPRRVVREPVSNARG